MEAEYHPRSRGTSKLSPPLMHTKPFIPAHTFFPYQGMGRCEQGATPTLTWSQSLSCWDHFPPAMHWNVAFCPTFTSTFWSRRKWGAFPRRETKQHVRTEFNNLRHCCIPRAYNGAWHITSLIQSCHPHPTHSGWCCTGWKPHLGSGLAQRRAPAAGSLTVSEALLVLWALPDCLT